MNSINLTILSFLFSVAGASVGLAFRARLPEHHLSRDSTDVIKLATGLMATLVALVLSLLISSANNTHATVESEFHRALVGIVQVDQNLRAYGPETRAAREQLRTTVLRSFHQHWPNEDFGPQGPDGALRRTLSSSRWGNSGHCPSQPLRSGDGITRGDPSPDWTPSQTCPDG